ncbi:hypothetical protein B0J12DRAFT_183903 [Macrophomina phaseolina]|uniref:Uncharacterized protein n=1 Tax=Macrophomina phaseolina TaxID=35725 RepID=A0ABQ8G4R9_9PEZI|nr:hypothetical protein B0J12DRAFT_183903 [Macrophomina phaseolina]
MERDETSYAWHVLDVYLANLLTTVELEGREATRRRTPRPTRRPKPAVCGTMRCVGVAPTPAPAPAPAHAHAHAPSLQPVWEGRASLSLLVARRLGLAFCTGCRSVRAAGTQATYGVVGSVLPAATARRAEAGGCVQGVVVVMVEQRCSAEAGHGVTDCKPSSPPVPRPGPWCTRWRLAPCGNLAVLLSIHQRHHTVRECGSCSDERAQAQTQAHVQAHTAPCARATRCGQPAFFFSPLFAFRWSVWPYV